MFVGPGSSNKTLGQICGAFKSLSTRAYWQWEKGRLWQRQYFDHIIRNEKDLFDSLEYIKMNPVRKGLVKTPDEWPFTGNIDELQYCHRFAVRAGTSPAPTINGNSMR
jgi:hypothetical protein